MMGLSSRLGISDLEAVIAAPFGAIGVRTQDQVVIEVLYLPHSVKPLAARNRVAAQAARQISKYLQDPDAVLNFPTAAQGTRFQREVWSAILEIPRGQIRSYGAIARHLATAPRAVGQACGANFYPLLIPCHRVVAAHGLGGFGGSAGQWSGEGDDFLLTIKRWLLRHEGLGDVADQ